MDTPSQEQVKMVSDLRKYGKPKDADFIARMERYPATPGQLSYLRSLHSAVMASKQEQDKTTKPSPSKSYNRTAEEAQAEHAEETRRGMQDGPENAAMMRVLMACVRRANSGEPKYLAEFQEFARLLADMYTDDIAHETRRQAKHDFVASMESVLK